jgi:ankyrin repeat protein
MKSIHRAAEMGDLGALFHLVSQLNVGIDSQSSDKSTALHFAVRGQSQECVQFLLQQGASTSLKNDGGLTPLHIAAKIGNEVIALLLLESSSDPNARDNAVCFEI